MSRKDIGICCCLALSALILATIGSEKSIPKALPPPLAPHYLPESWEPDDDNGLDDSIRFLRELTLRPQDFIESSFPKVYVAAAEALVLHTAGDGIERLYASNPERFVHAAFRTGFAISALFFAGAVLFTFAGARAFHGPFESAFAALAVLLNVGVLTHAHFAVYDVHLLFFEALLLYLVLRGATLPWLTVAVALMASIKYTGLLFYPLAPLAVFIRSGRFPGPRDLLKSVGILAAVFLALNPYAAIELPRFVHDLGVIYFTRTMFKGFHGSGVAFGTHIDNLMEAGPFFVLLAAAAFVSAVFTRRRSMLQRLSLLAFLLYYMLSGWSRFNAVRFSLPLVVPLALLIAPLLESLLRFRRRLVTAFVCAGAIWAALACVEADSLFYRDSRIAARRFIDSHGCATVASLSRTAYVRPALPEGTGVSINLSQAAPAQPARYYRLQSLYRKLLRRPPAETVAPEAGDIDHFEINRRHLAALDPECIVLSSFDVKKYFDEPDAFPETTRFLNELIAGRLGYAVARRFKTPTYLVGQIEFVNPEIVVLTRDSRAR